MIFLEACRRAQTSTTPIWMMRQAGRSLPAYRAIKEKYGFLEMTRDSELMASVTMMPFDYYDVDVAIAFADIMLPIASLGVPFDIKEGVGPVIDSPIRSLQQIEALTDISLLETCSTVFESIRIASNELGSKSIPVIGFSGAPFTLACYLVEGRGSREFNVVRGFMHQEPAAWHALMNRLSELIIEYLSIQVESGAKAVQLFDSWVGVLGPRDFNEFVMPYTQHIMSSLKALDVPRIHFGTNTATLLGSISKTDPEVVGVDWRIPMDEAWSIIGDKAVQGNLDPSVLLGPPEVVEKRAREILDQVHGRPGHIFNLGHGVLPQTPLDNLKLLVDTVHAYHQDS